MTPAARIAHFLQQKPAVAALFSQLNSAGIRWGIFAGCAVSLLTGSRQATDVDVMVHNDDFDRVASFLPQATRTDAAVTVLHTPEGERIEAVSDVLALVLPNAELEIEAHNEFKTADYTFPTHLTDLATAHRLLFEVDGHRLFFMNPFDVMLIKALVRRGTDVGKHDIQDIQALAHTQTIDIPYAQTRLQEVGSTPEALAVLQQYGLNLQK